MDDTDVFNYLGNDLNRWRHRADALAYNAQILTEHRHSHKRERREYEREHGVTGPELMFGSLILWGYAVEAYLKCLYLKSGKQLVVAGQLDSNWRTHDLAKMAAKLKLVISAAEQRMLETLAKIAEWSGRYPIATTAGKTLSGHFWSQPEDDVILSDLVDRLRSKLDAT